MNGYVLIDKPKGWTSFDVVNKVRHLIQNSGFNRTNKKRFPVGHTGTLDPLATGLLVILMGDYTKRAPGLTKLDKTYQVTMHLGRTSSTGDAEGVLSAGSTHQPAKEEMLAVTKQFVGEIEQVPPVFSAIKIDGKRAYQLAREGKDVTMEPRKVKIYEITEVEYTYPSVRFIARVSSGTYIRSLVQDIGEVLKTGAYMTDLRRTAVGDFDITKAISVESLSAEQLYNHAQTLD